ncbi:MAG TPA: hypothetical protein VM661_13280 [Candidatus Sulfotelmatobacter sp.]|jgi:hypothetical protein|nr:hypothetical protein [Candidatus Sulfotelmatobacter sp.]
MMRLAVAALSALAYLSAFLMPMLPASASAMSVGMEIGAAHASQSAIHAHCADAGQAGGQDVPHKTMKAASDLCRTGCAAHAPALPSQALAAPLAWVPAPALTATPHQRLTAALVAPDPRPPRSLSFVS